VSASSRENGSVAPAAAPPAPPTTAGPASSVGTVTPSSATSSANVGPGLQLAPLRAREDRSVERERDTRADIKDRRKQDRDSWARGHDHGHGHGHGHHGAGAAPSSLGGVSRDKRLSIGSILTHAEDP
jgi:hypothetical protein